MATKISVTKKLEKTLREIAADTDPGNRLATVARQLVGLIDDAVERKAVATGLKAPEAVNIIRNTIGMRCLPLPPNPTPLLSFIKARILFLGLEPEDVEKAARNAAARWNGPISIEWVFKRMNELLADEDGGAVASSELTVVGRGD